MTRTAITHHAEARMSQRGIRKSDIDVLVDFGTEIGPGRFMLRKRDATQLIREHRSMIAILERMAGKEAVIVDGRVITAYHRLRPDRLSRRR